MDNIRFQAADHDTAYGELQLIRELIEKFADNVIYAIITVYFVG